MVTKNHQTRYPLVDMRWVGESQCQKLAIRIHEPHPPIQALRGHVVLSGFHEYSAHAALGAEGPHFFQRGRAQPRTTKRRLDEQVIQKSNQTTVLHAEAQGHDHVSHVLGACLNEPRAPEPLVGQQRGERLGGAREVQRVVGLGVKLPRTRQRAKPAIRKSNSISAL